MKEKTTGEIVKDYFHIIENNPQIIQQFLKDWMLMSNLNVDSKVWNGRKYVHNIIFTIEYFLTPKIKQYFKERGIDVIKITEENLKK